MTDSQVDPLSSVSAATWVKWVEVCRVGAWGCRPSPAPARAVSRSTASGVYSKCWPRGPFHQVWSAQDMGQQGRFRASAFPPRSRPKAQRIPRPAAPTVGSSQHHLGSSETATPHWLQPRPLPKAANVARLASVLPAGAGRHWASRARTQAPRRIRAAAGAGVPSRRSPRLDAAVSRELVVNSPEWRPEACSPRGRRYPAPPGPKLEAAAGTSGGRVP